MACSIKKSSNGKINRILDENGKDSKLFYQIFNVPTLSLEEAIKIYQNTFSSKVVGDVLTFETPSGQNYNSYLEALQNTSQGNVSLKVGDTVIATVNSDTNIKTFEGSINHLVKNGVLSGERVLDVNGDIITITAGGTEIAKNLTADLVETVATKLLGESGVYRTNTGDFIFTNNLNKRLINGELIDEKEVNEMNYSQLKEKFGEDSAISIEVGREFEKQMLPTEVRKRIDEDVDIKSEDELTRSIKSLLNELGVKITSIEDYEKNNTIKNGGVPATSSALMDVVNKIMAFRGGTITREDLIEETMHLIEASLDPKITEAVRKVIHTTPEWKEHSALYYEVYSKEYSGEKLEEMVRREILGKVMANGVATNFELSQDATLTNQTIFTQIIDFLTEFFDKIGAYFGESTQSKIDKLNKDIYVKLISGELGSELNNDENFGTKFRLYSASENISNDLVQIQKQAEHALLVLKTQSYNIGKKDASQKAQLTQVEEGLDKVREQFELISNTTDIADKSKLEKIARAELIATFSHMTNVAQKQLLYLQRAVKKGANNNFYLNNEENSVYSTMITQFDRYILPSMKSTLENNANRTKAENRILEEVNKTIDDVVKLKGQVGTLEKKSKDVVVDLLVKRLGLSEEKRQFIEEQLALNQDEIGFFFKNFGTLAHSSNILLNAAGHVTTKTTHEYREGALTQILPFIKRIKDAGYLLGGKVKELVKDGYLVNRFNDKAREEAILQAKYEIYKDISKDDVSRGLFDQMKSFPKLSIEQNNEAKQRYEDWYIDNISLSAISPQEKRERKKELETYSIDTQRYERKSSLSYYNIMQDAEVVEGIPHFTQDMKQDYEQLKKDRVYDKSIYDRDGDLKEGLELKSQLEYETSLDSEGLETNIIKLGTGLYAKLKENNIDKSSILSFELSKLDNNRIIKSKSTNTNKKEFSEEFIKRLSSMNNSDAYDFLTLNAYVGYTNEYYETFNKQSIIDKLNEQLGGENDWEVSNLIEKIATTTRRLNTILQANREMNSPSEVSFTNMEKISEVDLIKEYSQDLEGYYKDASALVGKKGEEVEEDNLSETIPNKAFQNYMFDTSRVSKLAYNKEILDQEDVENIDKTFSKIIEHTTLNNKEKILNLRSFISKFSSGEEHNISKKYSKIFSKTKEEYGDMSEEQIFSSMTNDALQYSYTRLLPYFRKSQPIAVDKILLDLRSGLVKPADFLNNYFKGDYKYLNISPNYNFQKANEANNKNPHFAQARANGTPLFRTFELEDKNGVKVTVESIKNKSVEQLYNEGKLNKFVNKEFLTEYNIDLEHLFTTGEERQTVSSKKFEARSAFVDLQKQSLELIDMTNSHNIYRLPQKEKGKFRKIEDILKKGSGIKELADELINFREDEASLGQDSSGKATKTITVNSIPKKGVRTLSQGEATDEILESYTWMNREAHLFSSRNRNIGDMLAIKETLLGSEFSKNLSAETTETYKMFEDFMNHNFFDVKETWSKEFQIPGTKIKGDWASVLKTFGGFIRLRNLGFTLISPITSALSAGTTITIEKLVGENINISAVSKAKKLMAKHANGSMREMLSLESTSWLNSVGAKFGFFENQERFEDSNYGKTVRFLGRSPYIAHTIFNFPTNPLAALAVLVDHKFVDGKMIQYNDYKKENKQKTDKELKESWKAFTDITDVLEVDVAGVVTYDYKKIAEAMNSGMTEDQAKEYMDEKSTLIHNRVKIAIQKIDGQISTEDKSAISRNAFASFMGIHRNWLFVATQNRFKKKQLSFATGNFEEGAYTTLGRGIQAVIGDIVSGKAYKDLNYFKEKWESGSDESRRNLKRVAIELGVLHALIGLTLMAMKKEKDPDEDSKLFKLSSLFLYRTTNEISSSTVGLPKNLYDTLQQLVVGLNSIDAITKSPHILSSDLVKGGRFRGMTEREKYLYSNVPLLRDYHNLGEGLDSNIKNYKYFNFDQGGSLNYFTLFPFLVDDTKK